MNILNMLSVILDVDRLQTVLMDMSNKMEQQDARLSLQDDIINDLRKGWYSIFNSRHMKYDWIHMLKLNSYIEIKKNHSKNILYLK